MAAVESESEIVAVKLNSGELNRNEKENVDAEDDASKPKESKKKPRIRYIDRLRVLLTFLLAIHHCFYVVQSGWAPL
jgi:hypothetical protein